MEMNEVGFEEGKGTVEFLARVFWFSRRGRVKKKSSMPSIPLLFAQPGICSRKAYGALDRCLVE